MRAEVEENRLRGIHLGRNVAGTPKEGAILPTWTGRALQLADRPLSVLSGNRLPLITAQPYRIFGPEGQHGIAGHANTAAAGLDRALVRPDCPYSIFMGTDTACVQSVADSSNRVAHALDRDRLHTQSQACHADTSRTQVGK